MSRSKETSADGKFRVENVKLETHRVERTPEIKALIDIMKKHPKFESDEDGESGSGTETDPYDLLPKAQWETLMFNLRGTSSAFANAIRRIFMSEIKTSYLSFDHLKVQTTDDFIRGKTDELCKNISFIPINQEGAASKMKNKIIYLLKTNNTGGMIDVYASDLVIRDRDKVEASREADKERYMSTTSMSHDRKPERKTGGKTGKPAGRSGKADSKQITHGENPLGSFKVPDYMIKDTDETKLSDVKITDLVPNPHVAIAHLRAGCTVYIPEITIESDIGHHKPGACSLLDAIYYENTDVIPYDQSTGLGTRSINSNPTEYRIGFRTAANISAKTVMRMTVERFRTQLNRMDAMIAEYAPDSAKKFYRKGELRVEYKDGRHELYFENTLRAYIAVVAKFCFLLDPTIAFVVGDMERLDTDTGFIKITHPDHVGILRAAIAACQKDIDTLEAAT